MARPSVAIVGAGIAGLAAGRALREAGCAVRLFDKGRGIGGRLSWRRTEFGGFDHGAQYVRAQGDAFRDYLEAAEREGCAARWPAAEAARADGRAAYVGAPGMSRLVAPLSEGLDIASATRVDAATRSDDGWRLAAAGEFLGVFDALVVAIPAPQAAALFDGHPLAEPLLEAHYAPCWTGMFAFDSALDLPEASRAYDGPLAWVAHDGAKPGRGGASTLVAQAGPDWSRAHLERGRAEVAAALLAALLGRHPELATPAYADAHRWRYAQVTTPLGVPCVHEEDARLVFCGDYCLGGRVEAAFDSGRAGGAALVGALGLG